MGTRTREVQAPLAAGGPKEVIQTAPDPECFHKLFGRRTPGGQEPIAGIRGHLRCEGEPGNSQEQVHLDRDHEGQAK
eukprot:5190299-Heterocapsa_arctica.AAC.1